MKRFAFLCLALSLMGMGCSGINLDYATGALVNLGAAATISNEQINSMAVAMRAEGDHQERIAAANSTYARRLARLMSGHNQVNGIPLNFKVYLRDEVNANASADGSIRVYAGLMDLMTDDELLYVLGHEIGHVANGDILKATRTAYMTAAARQGVAALHPAAEALSASLLGDLLEAVVNAQYSQAQERAADDYALQFMLGNNYNARAAVSALRKLEDLNSSGGGLLASHPDPGSRAQRLEQVLAGNPAVSGARAQNQISPPARILTPSSVLSQRPARPQLGDHATLRPQL